MKTAGASGSWLGLGFVFVLGAASGYALGQTGVVARSANDDGATDVASLRQDVRELGRAFASWKESGASPLAVPQQPNREPLDRASAELDLAPLRELVERLERAAERAAVAGSPGALVIPARASQPLPLPPQDDDAAAALTRRFQLWTYQQVLDAFGRPDRIDTGDEVEWWYRRGREPNFEGWFKLDFCDGYVVDVYVE